MADAIVSVVLQQLISIIGKEIQQEVRLVTGVEKEIEKLTSSFQAIQAVLLDADQKQVKDKAVGFWLDRLRDASYDMDDILDEWNTAIQKSQMEGAENAPVPRKVRFLSCSPRFCFKQAGLRRDIAIKIKEINEKVDVIAKEKDMYNLNMIRSTTEESPRLKSTSFVDLSEVCGREEEKNDLVGKLLSECDEGKCLHVISIVGVGGIGKTTLAQLAYNDKEIISKFEKRIWVCVSDPFDEIRIAKAIIEALKGDSANLAELQSLLACIQDSIAGKKFFLVLDDVWTEDYNKWGPLYSSLNNGLHGSKIVVTTRNKNVANVMKSFDIINVGKLSEDKSWSLFRQLAFCDRSLEECRKLEKYGRGIVDKCKGLPLAVKTVGSLLRFKKWEHQWQKILESEMWNLEELEEGVFAPLLLSYNNLPSIVKQCFLYCASFPKDYLMNKDELIKLWMAQGYLGSKQNEEMEMVGEECFDNLAIHSFFQEFRKDKDGNIVGCKMHDIIHAFARYIAKNECFDTETNGHAATSTSSSWSDKTARHLMLMIYDEEASFPFKKFSLLKLRSLFVNQPHYFTPSVSVSDFLSNLLKQATCLRALTFVRYGYYRVEMIPEEIEQLTHLRYLNFSSLPIPELPEKLCNLFNLETLNIGYCRDLKKLPQGMSKLINLRHLINCETYSLSYMPKGIERLICLRTLDEVVIGGDSDSSQAYTLECLKKLNNLRGSLKIKRLGNVKNEAEAKKAELKNKKELISLELNFDDTSGPISSTRSIWKFGGETIEALRALPNSASIEVMSNDSAILEASQAPPNSASIEVMRNDAAVLEALQAPPNLHKLKIKFYGGITMSFDWMVSLTRLKELFLEDCIKCEHLPPLGKLPSLELLEIYSMWSVNSVGNEFLGISPSSFVGFPKLNRLCFYGMEEWEDWGYEITKTEEQDVIIMPRLSYLKISNCPKLKALPDHLRHAALHNSLVIHVIHSCTSLTKLPYVQWIHNRHSRLFIKMTWAMIYFKNAGKRARAKFSGSQ